MDTFDIYFRGEIMRDADPDVVRAGVARLFKVEGSAVDKLFSGKPLRVKRAVDAEKASRYRATFREIGALVQIVPAGGPAPEPVARQMPAAAHNEAFDDLAVGSEPAPPAEAQDMADTPTHAGADDLLQTGALDDVTEITITAPAQAPDLTRPSGDPRPARGVGGTRPAAFGLAEPGAIIDPTPPPPPAEIDVSGLEALPPNTGSLEDCRADKPPRPIPDISHLQLVDD